MDLNEKIEKTLDVLVRLSRRSIAIKILAILLSEERAFSLREIAHALNASENATAVQLHFLVKQGLAKRIDRGSYMANTRPLMLFLLALLTSSPQPNEITKKLRRLLQSSGE